MALTPRTAEFHKLREELDAKAASPEGLTPEGVGDFLKERGVNPEEFSRAWTEFEKSGYQAEEPGMLMGRIAGRAIGETGEFLGDISSMIIPEITDNVINWMGENIPEDVRRTSSELFDPYHGDGWVEPLVGELAAIMIPYTGIMKGSRWAKTGLERANRALTKKVATPPQKFLGSPTRIPQARRDIREKASQAVKAKATTPVKKLSEGWARKERFKKRGKGLIKEGAGMGGAMTVVYGPEEDLLTNIIEDYGEKYPEIIGVIDGLAIDPDDSALKQQLNAFLNNVVLELPFGFAGTLGIWGVPKLAEAARRMKLGKTVVQKTGLSNLNKWAKEKMTSRYGVDDTMLAMALRRMYAGNKAVSEADGIAQDLMRAVKADTKRAGLKLSDIENTVNTALGGHTRREQASALNTLSTMTKDGKTPFTNTVDLITRMRTMIDDLSESLIEANDGIVIGDLAVTMKHNVGMYLNRAYRLFDDPSFEGWEGLTDDVKEQATNYVLKMGANKEQAEYILKKILSREGEKYGSGFNPAKFLSNMNQTSNKPFYRRSHIPWEIKDMIGEIKDPYKNFARTYEKLSTAKAEADFLHSVKNHLLDHNLAIETVKGYPVSMGSSRIPKTIPKGTTQEEALKTWHNLTEIGDERLRHILGKKATDRVLKDGKSIYQAKNPLEDLLVNDTYAKFIREGTELFSPAGALTRAFLLSKVGTQTAKTVLSPATHGRNIMGNVILLGANGYNPFTVGKERGALETVKKRLRGYSDEEFGKYVGRLQELGIVDSSVKAQTVKKIASEAFNFEPRGRVDKLSRTWAGKATKKTFELYQAEDDIFKIIHFQKTMDDMKKWDLGLSNDALEEMAAARTRDLMPNYALVPKSVKWLRRSPLSDFAAWPSEITRVSKNLLKYSFDDVTGKTADKLRKQGFDISDKAAESIRDQGYKRTASLVTASMAGDALQNYSMNMMGLGQEDVYNINRLSPSWSQDTAKVFLSPINEDKSGHIGVDFINLGPIDPFSYLKAPARMLVSHLKSGRNLDRPDYAKLNVAAYDNVVGPFLGASMATELAMKLASGTLTKEGYEELSRGYGAFAVKAGVDILKTFEPGVATLIRKQWEYNHRKKAAEKHGRGVQSQFGYTMPPAEFEDSGAFLRWAGIRKQRLDISAGIRRNLLPLVKSLDNAPAQFTKDASDPRGKTQEQLYNTYKDSVKQQLLNFKELKSLTHTYDSLLKDSNLKKPHVKSIENKVQALVKGVTKNEGLALSNNLFKYMDFSRKNMFVPFLPTKRAATAAQQTSGNTIPYEQIIQLHKAIAGKTITD